MVPRVSEKVQQSKKNKNKIIKSEIVDESGYDLNDIIKECPKIDVIRDFFRFQCENIYDEDNNLFV